MEDVITRRFLFCFLVSECEIKGASTNLRSCSKAEGRPQPNSESYAQPVWLTVNGHLYWGDSRSELLTMCEKETQQNPEKQSAFVVCNPNVYQK